MFMAVQDDRPVLCRTGTVALLEGATIHTCYDDVI